MIGNNNYCPRPTATVSQTTVCNNYRRLANDWGARGLLGAGPPCTRRGELYQNKLRQHDVFINLLFLHVVDHLILSGELLRLETIMLA